MIGVLLVIFVLGPHMPPGSDTAQAHEQHEANIIITAILTPIAIGLLVYFAYALTASFASAASVIEDGPPIHGNSRLQGTWLISTVTIVLFWRPTARTPCTPPSRARPARAAGKGRR